MSQEYLIKSESLTNIADEIRTLSGTTASMGLDAMKTHIEDANSEVDSQVELLAQAVAALEGKASGGGVTLPTLTNPASASDIMSGKEAIDGDGNVLTGTIATKTSSNLTASGATVTVPAGYYASNATKSVATATQATPSVSVNSSGLVTASATQTAGYVSAGTQTATKQLTTQAAKTITPSTTSQTAVSSGVYTTGAVTVAAIPSQYITTTDATAVAADIRNGKTSYVNGAKVTGSIQDFDGSYECSDDSTGSGGTSVETCTVNISVFNNLEMLSYTAYENDEVVARGYDVNNDNIPSVLTNVVCGSAIFLDNYYYMNGITVDGGVETVLSYAGRMIFRAPLVADAIGTINVYDND